jgi:hypothetical protein
MIFALLIVLGFIGYFVFCVGGAFSIGKNVQKMKYYEELLKQEQEALKYEEQAYYDMLAQQQFQLNEKLLQRSKNPSAPKKGTSPVKKTQKTK